MFGPLRARRRFLYGGVMLDHPAANSTPADRHRNRDHERLGQMFEQAPGFMALVEGADHRLAMANRAFFDLVGKRDLIGRTVTEALPEFAGQGFVDLLGDVAASGEPLVGQPMSVGVAKAKGLIEEIFVEFALQPLRDSNGQLFGIFVEGHDVTEHKRGEALRLAHNNVLELAIGDNSLEHTLGELVRIVEFDLPNRRAGVDPLAR